VVSRSEEPAHDVLAAEAFAVPARDPDLNAGPLLLPEDPRGIAEPHDVLAAEEFPMPAPRAGGGPGASATRPRWLALALGAALTVAIVVRLLRRR
jgi:hypothetical protein